MNIAIVPWEETELNNRMFNDKTWYTQKNWFEKHGHKYETIDRFKNWSDIDWILIFYGRLHRSYLRKFLCRGMAEKLIYVAFEPGFSDKNHSEKGIKKLLKCCKYILTWNPELVDNKRVFKHSYPYLLAKNFGDQPFDKRKLLTAIYGNHFRLGKNILYVERRKIFQYFDNFKEQFDLYGRKWGDEFKCYKGVVDNKIEVYHNYRFAISLENVKGVKGYVTEKIFDCICAGIVPIYWGADDISSYVPEDVFIDYSKFNSVEELQTYLSEMGEETWNKYREAMCRYLNSEQSKLVSPEVHCSIICKLIIEDPAGKINFSLSDRIISYLDNISLKESLKKCKFIKFIWENMGVRNFRDILQNKHISLKAKNK